jgi:glyoxylase-like metal-dependent hydrolase (beta-lactamase superfamily II)
VSPAAAKLIMVEQIFPDIYKIEIPLPKSPLRALNAYLIKGPERSLLIDTGWNRQECLGSMLSALEELKVDLDRTDLFITHLHADHFGLVEMLARKSTRIYFGKVDASVMMSIRKSSEERFDQLFRVYLTHGFPEMELRKATENHPGFRYGPLGAFDLLTLRDGDRIEVGGYLFSCIETPGHSPGHMCLYEGNKKLLVSGDHILLDITPNITWWLEMENSLEKYLTSLEKVYSLDVNLVLPGHRRPLNNHRERIKELQEHHRKRLVEVLHALQLGEKTAWEVAPYLSWDLEIHSWERFPPVQKWFAFGETIAHLQYLEAAGSALSREHKGRILFSPRRMK